MCEHKRLKCVGHRGETRVFCADCGKELDKAFLEGKNSTKNPPVDKGTDKTQAKKTRAKRPFNGEL